MTNGTWDAVLFGHRVVIRARHQWCGDLEVPYWDVEDVRVGGVHLDDAVECAHEHAAVMSAASSLVGISLGCRNDDYRSEVDQARTTTTWRRVAV